MNGIGQITVEGQSVPFDYIHATAFDDSLKEFLIIINFTKYGLIQIYLSWPADGKTEQSISLKNLFD